MPLPITERIFVLSWLIFRLASSDKRRAQFRKIVIIQLSRGIDLHSISKRTDSSSVRYFGIRLGSLGVSSSSAILLSSK